jgi:hypothetical protein
LKIDSRLKINITPQERADSGAESLKLRLFGLERAEGESTTDL